MKDNTKECTNVRKKELLGDAHETKNIKGTLRKGFSSAK